MNDIENVGRCPRCKKAIIAEQVASHECNIAIKGAETIFLNWIADGFTDENDDYVRMAQGLDGTLLELVLCKHNPPHSTKRDFTGYGTKQGLDSPCAPKNAHAQGVRNRSAAIRRTRVWKKWLCVVHAWFRVAG